MHMDIDWVERAKREPIVDIGQISDRERGRLNRAAKRGELAKWRGFWNTFSPHYGLGTLKTCFGPPLVIEPDFIDCDDSGAQEHQVEPDFDGIFVAIERAIDAVPA